MNWCWRVEGGGAQGADPLLPPTFLYAKRMQVEIIWTRKLPPPHDWGGGGAKQKE